MSSATLITRTRPPGVYQLPPEAPVATPLVRLDVAAFIGLCERGPLCTPTVVDSWSAFTTVFGGAGGARLLPQSVQLFFANGGRRCVVVRCLDYQAAATSVADLPWLRVGPDPLRLLARDPGSWGNRLTAVLTVERRPLSLRPLEPTGRTFTAVDEGLAMGSLVAFDRVAAGVADQRLLSVTAMARAEDGTPSFTLGAAPPPAWLAVGAYLATASELTLRLELRLDGAREVWNGLGLHPDHPRHLPRVLASTSRWARPLAAHATATLDLGSVVAGRSYTVAFSAGSEGAEAVTRRTFFEEPLASLRRVPREPLADDVYADRPDPFAGLLLHDEREQAQPVALVHLPDLIHARTSATTLPVDPRVDLATTCFTDCIDAPMPGSPLHADAGAYPHLLLDGAADPLDQVRTIWLPALIQACAVERRVAIIDLPPGLTDGDIVRWRASLASAHAALYLPWLRCAPVGESEGALLAVPAGGAVCGIIARREREEGVHAAPANAEVFGAVGPLLARLPPAPTFLHQERVNGIRVEGGRLMLMGSRTTARELEHTHLPIVRLMDWLARQVVIDNYWSVFEPNDALLWRRLVLRVERRLRALFDRGALGGSTAARSWFVRCDETTTPASVRDRGQVVVEIGVHPAPPAEFIILRLALRRDGTMDGDDA